MGVLKSNVRQNGTAEVLGQLTELMGQGSSYELFSERNFKGSARILIRGYVKNSKNPNGDFRFTCSQQISDAFRACETEEEFDDVMDSLEFANVSEEERPATDRNGNPIFDKDGEPVTDTIYYLGFGDTGADMSSTRKTVSGKGKEVVREKATFSFEKAIAGMI